MSSRVAQRGFTLLEAVVAITVFTIGVVGMVQIVLVARSTSDQGSDLVMVSGYLKEGIDAVRIIRDDDWEAIAVDGSYRLSAQPGTTPPWTLRNGSETIGKFTRRVGIASVRRSDTDGNGTLSAGDLICQGTNCGSFEDPETKKVAVTVTWQQGSQQKSRNVFGYLTNWQ
ncbi:MAG TPA: prepilin-type N-terminal cleavage/methylation domain-containing protein [Patescibacteria group bacterium]|jgi:prepilin-type N-terminal cleavage/methylation domain-containing protein